MKCHNTDEKGKGIQGKKRSRIKERKEQFAVNSFGSKSQPNGSEHEWRNGESAERSFAVMAARMDERESA